jgi:phage repressor protein C with HTH and peptisase S24 domain
MQQFGSVADLARAVGVSDNAIYKWVSGRGQPSMLNLVHLARAARVSIEWLATGQESSRSAPAVGEAGEYVPPVRNPARVSIARGSAQSRQIVDYLAFKEEWIRRRLESDRQNVMLLEAMSDSMSPTIDEGDLMLVDLQDPHFRFDGVYLLRVGGELSVRRVQRRPDGKLMVRSDNPAYEPAVVAAEAVNVVGHVVWSGGRL